MVGCFVSNGPLDSISVYIGPSPRQGETREMIDGRKKRTNNPHPHPLQTQYALAPPLPKPAGRPGTASLPSTIVPLDHPLKWQQSGAEYNDYWHYIPEFCYRNQANSKTIKL